MTNNFFPNISLKSFLLSSLLIISIYYNKTFAQNGRKIAAFGSSVCNGTGDETMSGGYIGRFKSLMKKYNWEVVNVSRGGDNTLKIQDRWQKGENSSTRTVNENQYLIPQKPDYVIIGLSLANEGIRENSKAGRDSVFKQYRYGMLSIIDRCNKEGYKVVIANCYPHSAYTPEQYDAIKKMNLVINSWNVPSINLLGAIDDGFGHWIDGMYIDEGHPSSGGHQELFFSIVPTLFDALAQGKPQPNFVNDSRYATIEYNTEPAIAFTPRDTIHSFSVSLKIRNPKNVTILKIGGKKASLLESQFRYKEETRKNKSVFTTKDTMNVMLNYEKGNIIYSKTDGSVISNVINLDSTKWNQITYSYLSAKGETRIFLNDEIIIKTDERIFPQRFKVGLRGSCDIKDLLLYRSSLNNEEVKLNNSGKLFQSSLEIYSPLTDDVFILNKTAENLAQSLSGFVVKGKITAHK